MSALAFPPAPTLPRPSLPRNSASTRARPIRRPAAACPHRERHLRAVPTGLATDFGLQVPRAPESTPDGKPAGAPVSSVPLAFVPAPLPGPERTRTVRPFAEARVAAERSSAVQPATERLNVAQEGPLRLTTRGRRVLVAAAFALAIGLGSLAGVLFPSQSAMPEQVQDVVVSPGESLWVIASSVAAPGQDVREVVEQIRVLNGLEQSALVAGQSLTIPAS